uniref:Uncharacterized protein n=1 Tax=Tanacetum cinerariifolium TaxID=118510 RepID=A0A6L2K6R2_TANCI|nr:hypothetical protein [Tanacetum cinerariifolium]
MLAVNKSTRTLGGVAVVVVRVAAAARVGTEEVTVVMTTMAATMVVRQHGDDVVVVSVFRTKVVAVAWRVAVAARGGEWCGGSSRSGWEECFGVRRKSSPEKFSGGGGGGSVIGIDVASTGGNNDYGLGFNMRSLQEIELEKDLVLEDFKSFIGSFVKEDSTGIENSLSWIV